MNDKLPKALILDFGGVISKTMFETHSNTERALGLPAGTLKWLGPFAPHDDDLWQEMQADKITERDYWLTRAREVGKLVGKDWETMADFIRSARGDDLENILRPEMLSLVSTCKKNAIRLALLSNELDLFYGEGFRNQLSVLEGFDTIIDATYTGILKPAAASYQSCLDALDLSAHECLFVDDQQRNITGAEKLGIQTVHFDVSAPAASCRAISAILKIPFSS